MMSSGDSERAEAVSALDTSPEGRCLNCGAGGTGRYCPDCGQRQVRGRHTIRTMTAGFVGRFMNVEEGLLHTISSLTTKPGAVQNDYLAGRTDSYTHPAGYLLISFAAFAIMAELFGGYNGGGGESRIFTLLLVPFVAGAARLLFWRGGLNYAEHLIIVMYLVGHLALCLAVLHLIIPIANVATLRMLRVGALAGSAGYYAWGYSRVFRRRPLLAAAAGIMSLLGGFALWLVALSALLEVLRR